MENFSPSCLLSRVRSLIPGMLLEVTWGVVHLKKLTCGVVVSITVRTELMYSWSLDFYRIIPHVLSYCDEELIIIE